MEENFSNNEIINSAWMLIPGFLIWNVWKEHNNRIFKEKVSPVRNILKLVIKQLKETMYILGVAATGKPIGQIEVRILEKLELKGIPPQISMQIIKKTST